MLSDAFNSLRDRGTFSLSFTPAGMCAGTAATSPQTETRKLHPLDVHYESAICTGKVPYALRDSI